ncbi:MAG: hypothetical protein FWE38_03105 [Firmicutes bacterium]|nr:hypothetical protein [Bacillota bacterium]
MMNNEWSAYLGATGAERAIASGLTDGFSMTPRTTVNIPGPKLHMNDDGYVNAEASNWNLIHDYYETLPITGVRDEYEYQRGAHANYQQRQGQKQNYGDLMASKIATSVENCFANIFDYCDEECTTREFGQTEDGALILPQKIKPIDRDMVIQTLDGLDIRDVTEMLQRERSAPMVNFARVRSLDDYLQQRQQLAREQKRQHRTESFNNFIGSVKSKFGFTKDKDKDSA